MFCPRVLLSSGRAVLSLGGRQSTARAADRRTFSSYFSCKDLHRFIYFAAMGTDDLNTLLSVEFEVFGQVQGCFFTKYCKDLALQLGITGWVKNTKMGTIVGKLQGRKAELEQMLDWLSTTGSPGCKIERCELRNWVYLTRFDYNDFSIRF